MVKNDAPPPSIFVTTITSDLIEKLKHDLPSQGFELSQPPYTHFSAKKKGISCTLYTSLKLTVQGKEMRSFIEFYLEPEILKKFEFTYKEPINPVTHDTKGRIGVDESGKGDFFGPLCVAAVFASGEKIQRLVELGVKDSKVLSDALIKKIAKQIRGEFQHSIIPISPLKYNELYEKFHNLNSLLGWGHATVIESLSKLSGCKCAIIDQFAHESVVQNALKRKKLDIDLVQKHRAEADIVVAAASILARAAFLEGMDKLSQGVGIELPKGASSKTIDVGKALVAKWGKEVLGKVSKQHFKTTQQVLGETL